MNEPGFPVYPPYHQHPPNHLDPAAQEFFPTTTLPASIPVPPHIYYTYPPPPPPPYNNHVPLTYPPAYVRPPPPELPHYPTLLPPPPLSHHTTPSRTLLLSMVPHTVSESTVRRDLEIFGDVRAVQMERRRHGLVTVHFYDVRDAQSALTAVQHQHMQHQFRLGRHYDAVFNNSTSFIPPPPPPPPPPEGRGLVFGQVVWAQFVTPVTSGLPDGNNQGTLVVFNLDSRVSPSYLREIFEPFGPVKELRETPKKKYQRFVEFYDVRNAATALAEMNGKEVFGKAIVVDFSRPGGQSRKLYKPPYHNHHISPPTNHPPRNNNQLPHCSSPLERKNSGGHFTRSSYFPKGNPSGSRGSRSSSSTGSSFHESISNLSISGCDQESSSTIRRNNKKSGSCFSKKTCDSGSSGGGNSKQGGGGRLFKGGGGGGIGGGRHGKEYDPNFLIKEDAIMESNCRDSRTTVMIKNIPNKYSQKLLLNMLDNHCIHCNEQIADEGEEDQQQPLSSYDFVYLPIDFINKCNVGYGFVNMTSPEATLRLYKAFHHQSWEVFNSRKICEVTYARLQGLEALREHFKNSKFPGDAEVYMPVVFVPPRDGRQLTDPEPIVGGAAADRLPSSVENQPDPPQELDNGNVNDDGEELKKN